VGESGRRAAGMVDGGLVLKVPVPVVLASASSTRRMLMRRVVDEFEVVRPCVAEDAVAAQVQSARSRATALARAKARDVARRCPDALVIGADTLVTCRGEIVGKPRDRADAVRILGLLVRGPHDVVTGLCLVAPDGREVCACVGSRVRMKRLSRERIEAMADAPGALEAAGAYRLEPDDPNVDCLEGSVTGVMGLPLGVLRELLADLYPEAAGGCG